MIENGVGGVIVGAAIEVHRELGPGLFESVYEAALVEVLRGRGVCVARQVPYEVVWRGQNLGVAFKADLLVHDLVIVEIKAVRRLDPVHFRQVATYLRISGKRLGYLLNFDLPLMRDGVKPTSLPTRSDGVSSGVTFLFPRRSPRSTESRGVPGRRSS